MVLMVAASATATENWQIAAESLFSEGQGLVAQGQHVRACKKFEASQKLEAALGTSLNLAACWEKIGRTASSWAEFRSAAAMARKAGAPQREAVATERALALLPHLSRLVIVAPEEVEVTRNGELVPGAVYGSPIAVDPGVYAITASQDGKQPWTRQVNVAQPGRTVSVTVPPLFLLKRISRPAPPVSKKLAPKPKPKPKDGGNSLSNWGWLNGGVGLLGVVAGSYFGLVAASKWREARNGCEDGLRNCSSGARRLESSARTHASLANAAFATAGVGLTVGSLLLLRDAKDSLVEAEVTLTSRGLLVHGAF